MPMHRKSKNKANIAGRHGYETWFNKNVIRSRMRNKMAKRSRKINRKILKLKQGKR